MELVFNLLWLALSSSLIALWFSSRHNWAKSSLRPTTQMQILALAVLIVILFPVVSLTDDLQACTAPSETEHLNRRVDLLSGTSGALYQAMMAVATIISCDQASFDQAAHIQTLASITPAMRVGDLFAGYLRRVGNLPPPAAA